MIKMTFAALAIVLAGCSAGAESTTEGTEGTETVTPQAVTPAASEDTSEPEAVHPDSCAVGYEYCECRHACLLTAVCWHLCGAPG